MIWFTAHTFITMAIISATAFDILLVQLLSEKWRIFSSQNSSTGGSTCLVLMLGNLIKITRRPFYVSLAAFHIYVDQIEFSSRDARGIIARPCSVGYFLYHNTRCTTTLDCVRYLGQLNHGLCKFKGCDFEPAK